MAQNCAFRFVLNYYGPLSGTLAAKAMPDCETLCSLCTQPFCTRSDTVASQQNPAMRLGNVVWLRRSFAGHSHWHNIKHRKAAVDSKRQATLQRASREIMSAVRAAGGERDPSLNPRLARALESARRASMPKDRIARALQAASKHAVLTDALAIYEGVLAGGFAVVVRVAAERPQAIASEMRAIFSRAGGQFGNARFFFDNVSRIVVSAQQNSHHTQHITDAGIDAGAAEVEVFDDGTIEFICNSVQECNAVRDDLLKASPGLDIGVSRELRPKHALLLPDTDATIRIQKLLDALDNHPQVIDVVHNAQLSADSE